MSGSLTFPKQNGDCAMENILNLKKQNGLNPKSLIRDFEKKLHTIDRSGRENTSGEGPFYPMLTVYLGNVSSQAHPYLLKDLQQLWPQYRGELSYAAIRIGANGTEYARLGVGNTEGYALARDDLLQMTAELFDVNTHFSDYQKLILYYILDTSSFQNPEELDDWFDAAREMEQATKFSSREILRMLILFLDESNAHLEIGTAIRTRLRKIAESELQPKILILSNRRSDGRIIGSRELCYQIATTIIAVSNSADIKSASNLFRPGVITAGYSQVEKPYEAISQVCITALLAALEQLSSESDGNDSLRTSKILRERLGVTEVGTLSVMDEQINEIVEKYIPTFDQMDCFPLSAPETAQYKALFYENSPKRFNDMTFGAWDCYLNRLIQRVRHDMENGASNLPNADALYSEFLRKNFTTWELTLLAEEEERIREQIHPVTVLSPLENDLQEDARRRLRHALSSSPTIADDFCRTVRELGEIAASYLLELDDLFSSLVELHQIRADEQNFAAYYRKPLNNYLEANLDTGYRIREKFRHILGSRELKAFFRDIMEDMFKNRTLREALSATFEDVGMAEIDQTRRKLTQNVPVYLSVSTDMGPPIHSFVLLKTDSPARVSLFRNLKEHLPERTHFFNTGYGSKAEALDIYQVGAEQL